MYSPGDMTWGVHVHGFSRMHKPACNRVWTINRSCRPAGFVSYRLQSAQAREFHRWSQVSHSLPSSRDKYISFLFFSVLYFGRPHESWNPRTCITPANRHGTNCQFLRYCSSAHHAMHTRSVPPCWYCTILIFCVGVFLMHLEKFQLRVWLLGAGAHNWPRLENKTTFSPSLRLRICVWLGLQFHSHIHITYPYVVVRSHTNYSLYQNSTKVPQTGDPWIRSAARIFRPASSCFRRT